MSSNPVWCECGLKVKFRDLRSTKAFEAGAVPTSVFDECFPGYNGLTDVDMAAAVGTGLVGLRLRAGICLVEFKHSECTWDEIRKKSGPQWRMLQTLARQSPLNLALIVRADLYADPSPVVVDWAHLRHTGKAQHVEGGFEALSTFLKDWADELGSIAALASHETHQHKGAAKAFREAEAIQCPWND